MLINLFYSNFFKFSEFPQQLQPLQIAALCDNCAKWVHLTTISHLVRYYICFLFIQYIDGGDSVAKDCELNKKRKENVNPCIIKTECNVCTPSQKFIFYSALSLLNKHTNTKRSKVYDFKKPKPL